MKNYSVYIFFFLISFLSFSQEKKQTAAGVTGGQFCDGGYVYIDNDYDGYGKTKICIDLILEEQNYSLVGGDCDDNNPSLITLQYWYKDNDGDGFGGTTATSSKVCAPPLGYVGNNLDCDDTKSNINPNTVWYKDSDGDGYGSSVSGTLTQCLATATYVLNNNDCDDTKSNINPATVWYVDNDRDGFGSKIIPPVVQCVKPTNGVLNNNDCDDNSASSTIEKLWYADNDNDGFGDNQDAILSCAKPANRVDNNLDECPTVSGSSNGCIVPLANGAFQNGNNYILTITPKIPIDKVQDITANSSVRQDMVYFDGLGRPVQQIAGSQSDSGKDIITQVEYDSYGRQVKEYLPYPSNQNNLASVDIATVQGANSTYYQNTYSDAYGFSERTFESSPLEKVLKQSSPGSDWALNSGHEIKYDYLTNSTANEVKFIKANSIWNAATGVYDFSMLDNGFYAVNQLLKNVIKDENWTSGNNNTIFEYKDKLGRTILKRKFDNSDTLDTYFVYDQFGNITCVIPPLANGQFDQNTLNGLCFLYKYDHKNRLVERKIPGKQWEFLVYDKLDRIVATGPAFSPFTDITGSGWLITKFDDFNRIVLSGWSPGNFSSAERKAMQDLHNSKTVLSETKVTSSNTVNGIAFNYTNNSYPTANFHVLGINYYDDYNFPNMGTIPGTILNQQVYYNNVSKPKGLNTGSWIRVLGTSATYKSEMNWFFYDNKGRMIGDRNSNFLGGYTENDFKLDFNGKIISKETRHKMDFNAQQLKITEDYTYNSQDRISLQTHKINSLPVQLISKNTFGDIGQLLVKKVGGEDLSGVTFLQKIDFKYNIKGWLQEVNNVNSLNEGSDPTDLFAFKINYNDNQTTSLPLNEFAVKKNYNGNISEIFWKTASDNKLRKYGYEYDNLDRLKSGIYQDPSSNVVTNSFNEYIQYDKNGNIKNLQRKNYLDYPPFNLEIDNLSYQYDNVNKNQLMRVTDNSFITDGFKDGSNSNDDFSYDVNGNLTTDLNKNIITQITYNHLNLPLKIVNGAGTIEYVYNSIGEKLEKKVIQGSNTVVTHYLKGGFQYINNNLTYLPHPEGYVAYESGSYKYVFNYTDHLGNVRISYTKDVGTTLKILEENNYYPYGLKHNAYNLNNLQPNYKYKFNGKEYQDELALNLYDFGARNYDPSIGRWMNIDPLAENSMRWTPYNYVYSNPISFIDPDGMQTIDNDDIYYINKDGTVEVVRTNDSYDTFNIQVGEGSSENGGVNTEGVYQEIARLEKNENGYVQFPESGFGFDSYGTVEQGGQSSGTKNNVAFDEFVGSGDNYLKPETAAALFGVLTELGNLGMNVSLGDMSSSNGSDPADAGEGTFHHGGHGHMGKRSGLDVDFRYVGTDGNSYQGLMDDNRFSIDNNTAVYDAASRFGFDSKNTYQGKTGSVPGVKTMGGHNNHGHLGMSRRPTNFKYN